MAVITKEQIEFLLEEGVKIRMENEALKQKLKDEYDRGYDDGHRDARGGISEA